MDFQKIKTLFPIVAALLLSSAAIASDSPPAVSQESVKKRIEREKTFLLRSSDEISRTVAFVNETTGLLIEQVEAAAGREPERKSDERLALLDWYQRYAEWLTGMSAELDQDVSSFFARHQPSPGWTLRYEELAKGSRKLAAELGGSVHTLEGEEKKIEARTQKINTAVVERRVLVAKDDLELARELWPAYRVSYERREAVYQELSDEDVLYLRNELRSLGEQQKYFDCLMELAKYELAWLNIKIEDFGKLSEIARVVGGNDAGAVSYALRDAIKTYEADMASLKRRSVELDAKIHGVMRTGSLRTLDLIEELSRYYDHMKSRYDRHSEWLRSQIGSYQADLIEIGKEL